MWLFNTFLYVQSSKLIHRIGNTSVSSHDGWNHRKGTLLHKSLKYNFGVVKSHFYFWIFGCWETSMCCIYCYTLSVFTDAPFARGRALSNVIFLLIYKQVTSLWWRKHLSCFISSVWATEDWVLGRCLLAKTSFSLTDLTPQIYWQVQHILGEVNYLIKR